VNELTLLAPAKINLCLHVLGKRSDGYHDLAMLMAPLDFGDQVNVRLTESREITLECPGVELPSGDENIAVKAARAVLSCCDYAGGVHITIDKQIPVAAGLGGGSSDAAAVMRALNELLGLELTGDRLRELGVTLGADVPFFVAAEVAWATGVGERLERVQNLPSAWYLLVNPGFAVSTAWAFGNLGLTTPGTTTKMPRFSGQIEEIVALLHNDLEEVTATRYPDIVELKAELLEHGALGTLMSGSGPTVFGVFSNEASARKASRELTQRPGQRAIVTSVLGN